MQVYDYTRPPLRNRVIDTRILKGRKDCIILLTLKQYEKLIDSEPYLGCVMEECDYRNIKLEVIDE